MPYSKDSRRRFAKPSAVQSKSLAPPSAVSILSSSTSGSNSTVTPERTFHSSVRPSRRYQAPPMEVKRPAAMPEFRRGASQVPLVKAPINVFSYMDKDEDEEDGKEEKGGEVKRNDDNSGSSSNSSSSSSSEDDDDDDEMIEDTPDEDASTTSASPKPGSPMPQMPGQIHMEPSSMGEVHQQHHWRKGKVREGSLHSDSGISVRSSSPEQPSPAMRPAYPNVRSLSSSDKGVPAPAQGGRHVALAPPRLAGTRTATSPRDWSAHVDPDGRPEEYYRPPRPTVMQRAQVSKPAPKETQRRPSKLVVRNRSHQSGVAAHPNRPGYDVLASVIHSRGDASLKPIYRKFEVLNNRILLYLQDELAELEIELRELDNAIAREDHALGKTYASRRAEARLPSQLHWRRMELIGRSYAKVEQYNRALASYSNLNKSLESASPADVHIYREWVAEHAPIVEQEAAFLNHELDLITVSARANSSSAHLQFGNGTELETPVIVIAFTLVSTIIVFKFVPRFLARIVISAMVGVASLCMLSPAVLNDVQNIKHWRRGITMYSAVMIVLAVVVN